MAGEQDDGTLTVIGTLKVQPEQLPGNVPCGQQAAEAAAFCRAPRHRQMTGGRYSSDDGDRYVADNPQAVTD
jgi:hypothetical protein